MYVGTLFLRNRPALELMRRLVHDKAQGATVRTAVLGCSIGVEVYSILWTLCPARPDLEIVVHAVDISRDVLDVAERGIYSPEASAMVGSSIFEALSEAELLDIFDWEGDQGRVKAWVVMESRGRSATRAIPSSRPHWGSHELVVASNFLCHMDARSAERCLRNLVRLVSPGGFLFVTGVDLDVRTKVALDLRWEPVPELRTEVH